jgi:murein DD-endopeptidase MepM/ murein hydrolase activator NlpD
VSVTIRTPDDENTTPGYFLPPFKRGWTYQGATYAGHSDFAVDFNRRTPEGGWLPDKGDPVLAIARGRVIDTDPPNGYVLLQHPGGYRSEYRHMEPVEVKIGQKVQRGDRLGRIGDAGNAPNGTHLHHRQYKRQPNGVYEPVPATFYGVALPVSVRSDSKPEGWKPPEPVYVIGPERRATWERAYKAAERALRACEARNPVEVPE